MLHKNLTILGLTFYLLFQLSHDNVAGSLGLGVFGNTMSILQQGLCTLQILLELGNYGLLLGAGLQHVLEVDDPSLQLVLLPQEAYSVFVLLLQLLLQNLELLPEASLFLMNK